MPNANADTLPERSVKQSMLRGAMRRCPACGQGQMFRGYLTIRDHCESCSEDLSHQRTDDGPAYLTILLVSHLGAPLLMAVYLAWRPEPMSMLLGFSLGAIVLSLILLPLIKGGFVGFQWARRMHGFDGAPPRTETLGKELPYA